MKKVSGSDLPGRSHYTSSHKSLFHLKTPMSVESASTLSTLKVKSESHSAVSDSLWPQKTGMGSLSLLQGIFPTQGPNPGLHCRRILYQLIHKGSSELESKYSSQKVRVSSRRAHSALLSSLTDVKGQKGRNLPKPLKTVMANTEPKSVSPSRAPFAKPQRLQSAWGPAKLRLTKSRPKSLLIPLSWWIKEHLPWIFSEGHVFWNLHSRYDLGHAAHCYVLGNV